MERARHRKSKFPIVIEGNGQISKQRTISKLAYDPTSWSGGTTEGDLSMFEPGPSSFKRVTGTPMKKLLAEEMSKETEAKRRSPSVIARLMGLDGLPSPQSVHRQQKRLSGNRRQMTTSIGLQKDGTEGRSYRKSSMEQPEFKDVYEDLEASHTANRCYSSKSTANSKLTKPDMAFIQRKFLGANRVATNEMLRGSEEFHGTFEMLDSNKDLLLEFLQQPDSLFGKHLLELRGDSASSLCLKPSNSAKYEGNAKSWKSERETSCKLSMNSHRKREDGLLCHSFNSRGAHYSLKSSKVQLERKDTSILPARIVILKPNLGKTCSAIRCDSSPDSSHDYLSDCGSYTEYSSAEIGEVASWKKKDSSHDVEFSIPRSREAREIAKQITREMRGSFGSRPINLLYSARRGYARDYGSYHLFGSNSASESEVIGLSSRNSLDLNNRHKPSSTRSTESSVSREAKKKLSERWKMTHGYQDVGVVGRGSTLGEMLAISDRETSPKNLDAMIGLHGVSERFSRSNRTLQRDIPLGISSRHGWKDVCIRNSSRSRSLPPLSLNYGSHRTSAQREALVDDRYLMRKETMNRDKSKAAEENLCQKEDFSSKKLRYSGKKTYSFRHMCTDSTDPLRETHSTQIQMEKDFSEPQPIVCQMPARNDACMSSLDDAVIDAEHESVFMPSRSSEESLIKLSTCMLGNGDTSAHGQKDSNSQEPSSGPSAGSAVPLQCPGPELESSESSKEADHPSPVSVLEVPFTGDVSFGSKCFERVSVDLQGLRMQLQLLKMESEAYAEILPMRNLRDEDVRQGSITVSKEKGMFQPESWEFSYITDVLIVSGFAHTTPDTFLRTWHSQECPLDPWIFDSIEKYFDETTGMRSERRLLFDRINSAISEIYQWFVEPCPWMKPVPRRVGLKQGINDELHMLLASQEKTANDDLSEKLLDRELYWLDFEDNMDVIGKEIDKLLLDDLITEVVTS